MQESIGKFFISVFGFLSLSFDANHSLAAPADLSLKLQPQGTISAKTEEQTFEPNCRAKRTYPVLKGMKDKAVEKKLNDTFKKILTVGKKLKASDCPGKEIEEDYEYYNYYGADIQKANFIALYFMTNFPGGSGRSVIECRIYDVNTGKEVWLLDSFKTDTLEELQKYAGTNFKPFDPTWEPEGLISYSKQRQKEHPPFCLQKEGILVLRTHDAKALLHRPHIIIPYSMMDKFFKTSRLVEAFRQ